MPCVLKIKNETGTKKVCKVNLTTGQAGSLVFFKPALCARLSCLYTSAGISPVKQCVLQLWGAPAAASHFPLGPLWFWGLMMCPSAWDGTMDVAKKPRLPRIFAYLSLWLHGKQRAEPCSLTRLPPSTCNTPVSVSGWVGGRPSAGAAHVGCWL